jgi:hypothetical protein
MTTAMTQAAQFELDPWGRLLLMPADGGAAIPVSPVRMFPISAPDEWVALCDPTGKEVVCLNELSVLAPHNRQLLENELASREFIPVIQRVHHVSSLSEPCEWDVETDRGRTKFVLTSEDDVHRMSPTSAVFIDAHGTRYLIRDARQLDALSRRYVEWYL